MRTTHAWVHDGQKDPSTRSHWCQAHSNLVNASPLEFYGMTYPWPFSTWGIDLIGKIRPKGLHQHAFILVAIDYFTKWVDAAFFASLKAEQMADFICHNVIYRYRVPHETIYDNGFHFRGAIKNSSRSLESRTTSHQHIGLKQTRQWKQPTKASKAFSGRYSIHASIGLRSSL